MRRALRAFERAGPWPGRRVAQRLRETGPRLMGDMGVDHMSRGATAADLIEQGRDTRELLAFVERTRRSWSHTSCGRCLADGSKRRCRPHLRAELLDAGVADVDEHRALVEHVADHLAISARSFRWERRGTDTDKTGRP